MAAITTCSDFEDQKIKSATVSTVCQSIYHEVMGPDAMILVFWMFWTLVLEKTLESPLDCKEIQPVHSKGDQPWVFFGRNDAKAETPVLWPPHAKSWLIGCWEGLGAGGEGDDRGWDGWMASPTRWTWIWVNSGIWWWTGRPGVLRFMGSQSLTRLSDWTELNWRDSTGVSKRHLHVIIEEIQTTNNG